MNRIWTIIKNDAGRVTGSVVGLVVMIGLCVLPCLYAWFNIFSNWDPYGPASTSRIPVAVASEDQGTEVLGVELNVGQRLLDGLAANDQIGWVLTDSGQEARSLVDSGACYAALIVPAGFSADMISFLSLEFRHPCMLYYENGKINAIAPKITAKARTAVQEQVNAAVLQTVAGDAAKLASVLSASGLDPEESLKKISAGMSDVCDRLATVDSALDEASGLTDAASGLLLDADGLLLDVSTALGYTQELTGVLTDRFPDAQVGAVLADAVKLGQDANSEIASLHQELSGVLDDISLSNGFLEQVRDRRAERLQQMAGSASALAAAASDFGLQALSDRLQQLGTGLSDLAVGLAAWQPLLSDAGLAQQQEKLDALAAASAQAERIEQQLSLLTADTAGILDQAGDPLAAQVSQVADDIAELTTLLQGRSGQAGAALDSAVGDLAQLESALADTRSSLSRTRAELSRQAAFLNALADSSFLHDLLDVLSRQDGLLSGYIASPLQVEEQVFYEVESYGSQMAPFYTVLALWVGALFAAALIKTRLRPQDRPAGLTYFQHYLGRYGIFFAVAMIQSLITAVGVLLYVDIDCLHPWLFLLAVLVIGLCFSLINYTLCFTMGSVGLGLSVIVMLIQVAGSGGTYPIEVLPRFFRTLYPCMPFRYAMNALREAICGRYDGYFGRDLLCLLATVAAVMGLCLLLYRPARLLNEMFEKNKEKSGLMV